MNEKRVNVLLVEDEKAHSEAIRRALEGGKGKYIVRISSTIASYKSEIEKSIPDIVITDLNLPDGSAFDILNGDPENRRWPVVVMTAFGDEKIAVNAIKSGAIEYIVKSESSFAEITRTVEYVLREWRNIRERNLAENALRESEERFRSLIESSPVPIILIRDGKMDYINKAYRDLVGAAHPDEVVDKNFLDFVAPESHEKVMEYIRLRKAGKAAPTQYEAVGRRLDGSTFPYEINVSVISLKEGSVTIAFVTDLTERKKTERDLIESEQRMSQIIDFLPDATFAIDLNGIVIAWNKAIEKMTGVPAEEMLGMGNYEYALPFFHKRRKILIDLIFDGDQETIDMYRYLSHEGDALVAESDNAVLMGKQVWLWGKVVPLFDASGKVIGAIESIRDITEQKKAEQALLENESIFSSYMKDSPVYVFFKDKEMRALRLSKNYEKMLGMPVEDALGKTMYDLFPSELAKSMVEDDRKILEKGELVHVIEELNGRTFETTKFPIFKDGKPNMLAGLTIDITDTVQAEESLRESEERYRATVNAFDDAIHVIDRDFRIVLYNEAFIRSLDRLGYKQDPRGKSLIDCFPLLPEESRSMYENVINTGKTISNEEHIKIDGENSWAEVRRIPVFDKNHNVIRIVTMIRNISERKKSETLIKDTLNALYRSQKVGKIGSWQLNLSDMKFEASDVALDLFGFPHGYQPPFNEVSEHIHPDDRQQARDLMAHAIETGASYVVPLRIYRLDNNEMRYIVSRAEVEKDKSGKAAALFGINQDITDLKMVELALIESEGRFRRLAENAPDVIYRMSLPDGVYDYVSPSSENVMGYTPEEMYKNPKLIAQMIHPEWREYFQEQWEKLLAGDMPPSYEYKIIAKTDEEKWLFQRNILVKDENGKSIAIEGIVTDITERKLAEEALRESEARNKAFLDANPDLMFILTENGDILDYKAVNVNDLYAQPEMFLGKNLMEVVPKFLVKMTLEKIQTAKETGSLQTYEYSLEMDGTQYYESRLVPYGKKKYVAIIRNITLRKNAEEERLEMERRMLHVQKLESLGVLAGGIAHDFNNILMAVLGHADLALNELPPMSPARENISEIEKAARRASELSRQMLAYSGKGKFLIETIQLGELVTEMAHLLRASISKKAILNLNVNENLPYIEGDATQIRQVLMNLITNASEAIGDSNGVITVSTGAIECTREYLSGSGIDENLREGLYVYFEVSDTGIGMSRETISKIFEPFFTTKFTGRGLGMAAVLGIVRGHKGSIKIYSELGKGSMFKVLFPASEDQSFESRKGKSAIQDDWVGSGTVLLVDDEESIIVLGKKMLEIAGFDVVTAMNGEEAIKIYLEMRDKIVFVLMDLTMPVMDGEETFRGLIEINPEVKVLMSSGYSEQEISSRFAGKGIAGFIQKPFTLKDLIEKTREILADE